MGDYSTYVFKSGKHAGQTYSDVMKTEEGRSTFRWMVSQELPTEPDKEKLKFWMMNRNKWIKEQLELYPDDVEIVEKKETKESLGFEETALSAISHQVIDHEQRIRALECGFKHAKKEEVGQGWPEE